MKRSVLRKLLSIEMFILYTVLVTGALIFSFPFVWMIANSFKTTSEMGGLDAPLWPGKPIPRAVTPYIDSRTFNEPTRFFGINETDWQTIQPQLEQAFAERIKDWQPHTPAGDISRDVIELDQERYQTEMTEALFAFVSEHLSDDARAKGPDAVVGEAKQLVDDAMLTRAFDRIYRRVNLGDVRLRTQDYQTHITSGSYWTTDSDITSLIPRANEQKKYQQAVIHFTDTQPDVKFQLIPQTDFKPADIDRVMVGFRGDDTWARLQFEVIRDGRRYATTEVINFQDARWLELQFRWPDPNEDTIQRRPYFTLYDQGPAPANSEPFAVSMTITRNTATGAWFDKIMHQYRTVFREIPFSRYIMTSLSLSILSIVLMIFSCTLSAYAFARLNWPGRDLCFVIMLATMMIPPQVTMIPSFLIIKNIGWYDTLLPLWAPAAFGAPFFIFLLRQFLKTIPRDLEDAARIDGCGFIRVYWHVMFPLVTPTVAIIAVYTFIAAWNNFMGPLIYVNDERLFPLALGLFKFNLRAGPEIGLVMAASFVMTLPVIILFFFVQRYFIQGVTLTGMKG